MKQNTVKSVNLLSPHNLIDSLEKLFEEYGEIIIYKPDFHNNEKFECLLINMVYYFNLYQLPFFTLTILNNNETILNNIVNDIKDVFLVSKDEKASSSIYKISTLKNLEKMDTLYSKKQTLNSKQTLNKMDTLMSIIIYNIIIYL